jgi:hypothetical protein
MPHRLGRRDFLHVGFVGGIGLTLADFLRVRDAHADETESYPSLEGSAKSVIFIVLPGGLAHQESFDPKPNAPVEYRGPFGSIAANVGGVRLGELWRQTAQVVDKLTICRSVSHGEATHEGGRHSMFTKMPIPLLSVVNNPGHSSSSHGGFRLTAASANSGFQVRDLSVPGALDDQRFARRRRIRDAVDAYFRGKEQSNALETMDPFDRHAYEQISSSKAREAFDLDQEQAKIRDEYGRTAAGARLLLSRRLVEAGVRFVTAQFGSWDMHNHLEGAMRSQVPVLDQAFAALIRDLDRRGLLDSTLVSVATEFGRTPKINSIAGRDHWPNVFSVVLAGGGIQRGLVHGASNATASEPQEDALSAEDWATTIYHCLGIVADRELMASGHRPIDIVDGGKMRRELVV